MPAVPGVPNRDFAMVPGQSEFFKGIVVMKQQSVILHKHIGHRLLLQPVFEERFRLIVTANGNDVQRLGCTK